MNDSCSTRRLDVFPDLLTLHRFRPERYPYLLESVAHGPAQARYDILFAFPGASLQLDATGQLQGDAPCHAQGGFLAALEHWWRQQHCTTDGDGLPFRGGWFLYLGYELAAEIEPGLRLPAADAQGLPVAHACRCPAAVIRDHHEGVTWLVAEGPRRELLERMAADLHASQQAPTGHTAPIAFSRAMREEPAARYLDAVTCIKRYIRDGDVFQVNLSRQWCGQLAGDVSTAALYARLRDSNPAPFAALAQFHDWAIVSSSPERLVTVHDGVVETRPIAGTRPRATTQQQDHALSSELLAHPKERAEHIMLIDLERNDLGRVCRPGSIEVNEMMVLESYAHVHHIVSNVRGRARAAVTPVDVIRALFPGGTITGCPKVRCMEIIAELEGRARGAYTGALGYLNRDGDMDLNILIRTLVRDRQQLSFRAGAGIVADSDPQHELDETRAKARGLLQALAGSAAGVVA